MATVEKITDSFDWISAVSAVIASIAALVSIWFSIAASKSERRARDIVEFGKKASSIEGYFKFLSDNTGRLAPSQTYFSGAVAVDHDHKLDAAVSKLVALLRDEHLYHGTASSIALAAEELRKIADAYPGIVTVQSQWVLPEQTFGELRRVLAIEPGDARLNRLMAQFRNEKLVGK